MANGTTPARPYWMPNAQGFVAGSVILMAAVALFYRMSHASTVDDKILDMMLTILYGTAFVAIVNFLFGSSASSQAKDDTLSTLATAPVSGTPLPPTPAWWSRLTEAEKGAVSSASTSDPHVAAIQTAMTTGAATADDLAYLVTKLIVTPDRARTILAG